MSFGLAEAPDYYDDEGGDYYDDGDAYEASDIPDTVKNFVIFFYNQLKEGNVREIHHLYEESFNQITEQFYATTAWPSAEEIAPLVNDDGVFLTLYKELYFRHIYSKLTPTLAMRVESFETYCDLFAYILKAQDPIPIDLPEVWLWDIVDEYIYQFQAYSQFKFKTKGKSPEEINVLKANPGIWSVQTVLGTLHMLATKSHIHTYLERCADDPDYEFPEDSEEYNFGGVRLYRMLGYFSLVGQMRVHCLLSDYHLALKTIDCIDLSKRGLYTRVTPCHITLFYYLGFAYMMMRRYVDAIRSWSSVLQFISRTKQLHTRSYQYDQIVKKSEQMYSLLAIAISLCPQRIDENVNQILREKHQDTMIRMQRGDESVYEEQFSFACPKFIHPHIPNYDSTAPVTDAYQVQLQLFLDEVRQQSLCPTIRSYLKLYTTMAVPKLAAFLEMDNTQFRTLLLCYKHKTRNAVWTPGSGSALAGSVQSSSDVEFFVDCDMVHIADTKVERRYGEYFIRQIKKFDEIRAALEVLDVESEAGDA